MYIIIVGCGKVGSNLAKELSVNNHDVVVIDSDPDKFSQLGSGFNGKTILGVPIDEDILLEAGIEKADAVAAVSPDENINIMVSQIAKEIFHVPRVIPRIYDPDRDIFFQQLGLNTMCLTGIAVAHVKKILEQKSGDIWHTFGNKNIGFRYIQPDSKIIGINIKNISVDNYLIFGIIRDEEFLLANPDIRITRGDMLLIIIGGGKVGYYLARTLSELKHKVTVIESNRELCLNIANTTSNLDVNVINGDGTSINYLIDADIEIADALIAVTGKDQDNLIACQIAKHKFNIKKTIARVNNPKNIKIFEKLGVNTAVSSTASIVEIIEREVFISGLKSLVTIGDLSVNEIKLQPNYHSVNKQIKDLEFPKDCIIISIIRNNDVIIPGGSTTLLPGDEVIAVSRKGSEEKVENVLGKI
jgi:trk system potassium uptake protein TrkA